MSDKTKSIVFTVLPFIGLAILYALTNNLSDWIYWNARFFFKVDLYTLSGLLTFALPVLSWAYATFVGIRAYRANSAGGMSCLIASVVSGFFLVVYVLSFFLV